MFFLQQKTCATLFYDSRYHYDNEPIDVYVCSRRDEAFVTQQCLSNHIHRLEVSCGVKLFERTPHLQLTEAGKTLYQSFIQIRDIEEGTLQKLKTDTSSIHGTIRFGTHLNRARIFLIDPFLEFHEKYPDIKQQYRFEKIKE